MIVVDTSVFVDVSRRPSSERARVFGQLLDADEVALALPVRLELMSGVARKHRREFRRTLSGLPLLRPTDETWGLVESWVEPAADKGFRFSLPDLMIAALAHELDALVWALDGDFESMEELGMVRLYAVRQPTASTP